MKVNKNKNHMNTKTEKKGEDSNKNLEAGKVTKIWKLER